MRLACRLGCGAVLLFVALPGWAVEPTVPVGQFDSHKAYLELLDDSRERGFREIMALYDTHLSGRPGDVQAAVERCRFLENALYAEDEDYNPIAEEFEACVTKLESSHGNEPAVLELLLSQQWGEDAEPFYQDRIASRKQEFTPQLLARIHSHLSTVLQWFDEDFTRAALHAREAIALEPSVNLLEIVASFEWEQGHRDRALEATRRAIDLAEMGWELDGPIARLIEMEEFETARAALAHQSEIDPDSVDLAQQARVLAGVGDFAGARKAYDQAVSEQAWMEAEIRKERFRFELDHGDTKSALAAYNALRDIGFETDPLLRNRLDLLRHHPVAAWSLRDLLGWYLLVIAVIGILLLPAVLIVPAHYVALLRLRRPGAPPPLPTTWGLRHAWYLIAGYLLTAALGIYLFYPAEFIAWIDTDQLEIELSDHALLSSEWFQMLGFALALAAIVRIRRFRALWSSSWTWRKTAGVVALCIFVGRILAAISAALANVSVAASYQERWLLLLGRTHGAVALLVLAGVVVPILEEFAFRGVLLDSLHRYFRFWIANILQSLAFAVIHDDMRLLLVYFLFGFAAGEMRRRSRGLLVPIVFHAVNNLLASAVLVMRL